VFGSGVDKDADIFKAANVATKSPRPPRPESFWAAISTAISESQGANNLAKPSQGRDKKGRKILNSSSSSMHSIHGNHIQSHKLDVAKNAVNDDGLGASTHLSKSASEGSCKLGWRSCLNPLSERREVEMQGVGLARPGH
jgi:hypothetical protein